MNQYIGLGQGGVIFEVIVSMLLLANYRFSARISPVMKPVVLVTNDDGIDSEGLLALRDSLCEMGRVVVVAPDRQRSAASHALTLHRPLRVTKVEDDFYSIDGTPTDCVNISLNGLLDVRPSIVVSGINKGGNMGEDLFYSGTVAAAREAALLRVPSMAVSIEAKDGFIFEPAASFARQFAAHLVENPPEQGEFFNVNLPNLPAEQIKGIRVTRQGKRIYGETVVRKTDPRGREYFWIGTAIDGFESVEGSDIDAVYQGYISITPLHLDMTHHSGLRGFGESIPARDWLDALKR